MNSSETRTLWISVGCALFAVFLLYSHSQEKKAEYDRRYGSAKKVVVVTEDVNQMQTINESVLNVVDKPVEFIEPGAITDPQDAIGEIAAVPLKKGEQVIATKLLPPGPETGISLQVSPNKRAVTIPIDEVRGVAKLIRPGDRIDLISVLDIGKGQTKRREAKTILQDVVVLATGVRIVNNVPRLFEQGDDEKTINRINLSADTRYTTITLEATPKQAQDLAFILSTAPGSLYTILRNPNDRLIKRLPISNLQSVLGKPNIPQIRQTMRKPAQAPIVKPPPRQKKPRRRFEEI